MLNTLTRPIGVALVTGAAQGIGRAIALRLASDGFHIGLNDLPSKADALDSVAKEIKDKGNNVSVAPADVSDEGAVKIMLDSVVGRLGALDVMVSNSGIFERRNLLDSTSTDWDRLQNVNSRGMFLCYKYAAKRMIEQGHGGRIIGAASVAGKQGSAGFAAYSASKFAVVGLTQSAAKEFGPHGITVNAYAPGAIDTPMLMGSFTDRKADSEMWAAASALGRLGTPEDIAGMVAFLASKDASWITGQTFGVNGGLYCH
ncbi:hypothetical protein VKT23_009164 [Stygiomarasmius scandens]|uniref:Uncharacterized protein n=1 Tax=Marasmiellus scandens TaxID=2682957 RepID=A0ABR1JHZ0_9AGAR